MLGARYHNEHVSIGSSIGLNALTMPDASDLIMPT
jgi:hypothetical protein